MFDIPDGIAFLMEVPVELEHVSNLVGSGKSKTAVNIGMYAVVANLLTECFRHGGCHCCSAQVFACKTNGFADVGISVFENTEGAFADVFRSDTRHFFVVEREGEVKPAVRSFLRAGAEEDEIFPIKRGVKEGSRHACISEKPVGFAFGIEVRYLVFAQQGGHAGIIEGNKPAGVLQGGPDGMLQTGVLGGSSELAGFFYFLFRRKMRPEESDEESAVGSLQGLAYTLRIIHVGSDDLCSKGCERFGFVGIRVPADCPDSKIAVFIVKNGTGKPAALSACGAENGDDFFAGHDCFLFKIREKIL